MYVCSSKLHILLKEENIHAPYFSKTSHVIKVEESISQNQVLLHLEAKDDDCSNAFGNICMYQVDEESNGIFSVMDDGKKCVVKSIQIFIIVASLHLVV